MVKGTRQITREQKGRLCRRCRVGAGHNRQWPGGLGLAHLYDFSTRFFYILRTHLNVSPGNQELVLLTFHHGL